MAASYPTSVKSFTTKTNGVDDVDASHINDLQLEMSAVETELLTVGTWVPTFTGFSSDPASGVYRYVLRGPVCTMFIRQPNSGTSNATTFTITLPFTARTIAGMSWYGSARVMDNGTIPAGAGMGFIDSAGTVVTLYTDFAATGWTNSGNKRVLGLQMSYEVAS